MLTSMTSKFSVEMADLQGFKVVHTGNCVTKFYMVIHVSVIFFFYEGGMHKRVIINNYSFSKQNSYVSLNLFNLFGINVIINKLLTFLGSRIVGEDCYGN